MKKIQKTWWRFQSRRAEGYIDTAISVMILSFVLIFLCSVVSLLCTVQDIQVVADKLAEYACTAGSTDIGSYATSLCTGSGLSLTYDFTGTTLFDSTGKVQLGEPIRVHVHGTYRLIGFGNYEKTVDLDAEAMGISRVYWK